MLIESVLLAIITGYIFKGRIQNLTKTSIKGAGFIFGGLILRNLPSFLSNLLNSPRISEYFSFFTPTENFIIFLKNVAPVLFLFSFILMSAGVFMNRSHWPMNIIFWGIILNLIVVAANFGFMPVSREGLDFAGYDISKIVSDRLDMNHIVINANTRISLLSDIIPLPKPYPMPKMLSIGDIVMSVGVFIYIFIEMLPDEKKFKFREVKIKNNFTNIL